MRLGSGFYVHPEAEYDPSKIDFSIACKKFGPHAYIGGLSALYFYVLINEVPDRIGVIVPLEKRTTDSIYRLIRSKSESNTDIDKKGYFRISGLERTLLDFLRYESKIGLQTAVSAIRRALSDNTVTRNSLLACSKRLGLTSVLEKF